MDIKSPALPSYASTFRKGQMRLLPHPRWADAAKTTRDGASRHFSLHPVSHPCTSSCTEQSLTNQNLEFNTTRLCVEPHPQNSPCSLHPHQRALVARRATSRLMFLVDFCSYCYNKKYVHSYAYCKYIYCMMTPGKRLDRIPLRWFPFGSSSSLLHRGTSACRERLACRSKEAASNRAKCCFHIKTEKS